MPANVKKAQITRRHLQALIDVAAEYAQAHPLDPRTALLVEAIEVLRVQLG